MVNHINTNGAAHTAPAGELPGMCLSELREAFDSGAATPSSVIQALYPALSRDKALFITLAPLADLVERCRCARRTRPAPCAPQQAVLWRVRRGFSGLLRLYSLCALCRCLAGYRRRYAGGRSPGLAASAAVCLGALQPVCAHPLAAWRRRQLEALPASARKRLWGVPFAVKDNIDVAGFPTTAACPAFRHMPACSAPVVQALLDAGAPLCCLTGPSAGGGCSKRGVCSGKALLACDAVASMLPSRLCSFCNRA